MTRLLNILCVALLAGAAASYSDIMHSPTNFVVGDVWIPAPDELFNLDLDSNGTIDFTLAAGNYHFSGIHPENQNKCLILPSPPPNIGGPVAALDPGYLIGSSTESSPEEWFSSESYSGLILIVDSGTAGEFYNHRGYIGLEFEAEDGVHYGWLDIEGRSSRSSIVVLGWAYETTPGVGIVAGAVPEPSSMILFIIGAWGTWILRKEKNRYWDRTPHH